MKHLVTREEAALVRAAAAGRLDVPSVSDGPGRIFRPLIAGGALGDEPIAVVAASGRSGCRECGDTIPAGEDAIVFGFDPFAVEDMTRWARLQRAYLHAAACRDYPEED